MEVDMEVDNEAIKLLIVDDEEPIRRLLSIYLGEDYSCVSAASAEEAMSLLCGEPFNLVITDIILPGTSGIDLCQYIRAAHPEMITIMVSGRTQIQYAIDALKQGAFDYITKPFSKPQVTRSVKRALRHQVMAAAKRDYEQSLEETLSLRTDEQRSLNENLNQMLEALYENYRATLRVLVRALGARDIETAGRSDRLVAYSLRLGRELRLSSSELIALEQGALLHNIGKIGVRDSILLKQGTLTTAEWVEMREHINHGLRIINGIDFLKGAAPVVGQQHEKYDGSGYPEGLSGRAIHINARIFAVADAFDAMTSDCLYRAAASYSQARDVITSKACTHFDPLVVNAFLNVSEGEWREIRGTAETEEYIEYIIGKREIRSFIFSLKRISTTTGSLPAGRPF